MPARASASLPKAQFCHQIQLVKLDANLDVEWEKRYAESTNARASGLAATRSTFENPNDHVILPEIISKEPLGPLVRHGDDQWADIARQHLAE